MGKIDDLRKQRELRFAEMQRRSLAHPGSANANGTAAPRRAEPPPAPAPPEPANQESAAVAQELADRRKIGLKPKRALQRKAKLKPPADAPLEGKCRVCGKVRAIKNGLLVNHQKGLGKPCAGSRQKPV